MQPNQPYAPPPPQQVPEQNPYDFIMNSGEPVKKSPLGLPSGKSTLQRVLIFGGGILVLFIIGIFFMSFLGGGTSNTETLLSLAQDQTEIVRVADIIAAETSLKSQSTRALAQNTSLSVSSSKQQVVAIITKSGKKVNAKQLGLSKDAKIDESLKTALSTNQYDEVANQILITKLKKYRDTLKTSYDAVSAQSDKQVLSDAFKGTNLLLSSAEAK